MVMHADDTTLHCGDTNTMINDELKQLAGSSSKQFVIQCEMNTIW